MYIGIALRDVDHLIDDELSDMGPIQRSAFLHALDEDVLKRISDDEEHGVPGTESRRLWLHRLDEDLERRRRHNARQ